ncbi:suppressor protein SRP40 [Tetranychus urticae]|uniref:Uncharacterized protein n=1 Tax=Tetranychus urticae TaxID=32264 RepID=T1KV35_TETUR|nr:suppressor protein SRP40 [Tetranychus urticae]
MFLYHSILFASIFITTIQSHGSYHSRDRQGHERTWFQMSIPYLDTTIQFQPPAGLEPERLFDFMTPLQNWNPLEPPPFMRPFFDRPNQFRPMIPPPPPPIPPFSQDTPSTSSNPNSIPEPEPESGFSVSSSAFNPSRRRWKPRWHPHNRAGGHSGKRPNALRPSNGNGNGCRYVPGTKGGRKCRPGQRFWEKSKPSEPQPSWPFFVFPPPRPSISDDKPEVPNTFTEVTKKDDPACGNRHLPRPTKPSELNPPSTTTMVTTSTAVTPLEKNETTNEPVANKTETPLTSTTTTTTELPITPDSSDSSDVAPNTNEKQPSSNDSSQSLPSDSKSSDAKPEKDGNFSEFESKNEPNTNEKEPGEEIEKKKETEEKTELSVSSKPKDSDDGVRVRTNINNGEDISPSGMVTTMGPLEESDGKENGNKKMEETKDDDKKIESKENENVDGEDNKKKEADETVDLKYSPFTSNPSESSSPKSSSSYSSPESEVTTISNDNVNNEVVSTTSSTDLGNIDLLNEADTLPDEIDKGNNNKKSALPDAEAKRKREAEKEQFIKQIESMSIEEFRKLASKIASLSS